MHITASVFINDENQDCMQTTSVGWNGSRPTIQSRAIPSQSNGEDNGDAHHKRQIMGREVVVAITNGKLDFGPWDKSFMASLMAARQARSRQDSRRIENEMSSEIAR